jgi:hypothetical protein
MNFSSTFPDGSLLDRVSSYAGKSREFSHHSTLSTTDPVCTIAIDWAGCVHKAPYSRSFPALEIHQLASIGDLLLGVLAS